MTRAALLSLVLATAACGGLGTPDLGMGVVEGKVVGFVPGKAYVYALGDPRLARGDGGAVARVEDDGSFRLEAPSTTTEIVVYDGSGDPAGGVDGAMGRAQRVAVAVRGADVVSVADQDAAAMPLAGAVLVGVRGATGAFCKEPRVRVDGTDQSKVAEETGAVVTKLLAPLPAGADYRLVAEMKGFRPAELPEVEVIAGATRAYELPPLEVDDDDDERGCLLTLQCEEGFTCEDDGRCHGPDQACTTDTCSGDLDCDAGLRCEPGGPGSVCAARDGRCDDYLALRGAQCLTTEACDRALRNGICVPASGGRPSYCTAPCSLDSQCDGFPGGGWTCDGYCRPP